MQVTYFTINREYEIKCKLFKPEIQRLQNVVIGVHGFAGDKESSMLEQLAYACETEGTGLLCFDFPAHGESQMAEVHLTINNCQKDLYAVVEYVSSAFPNVNISIFATSFGGYITLLCANKLGHIPTVYRAPAVTMPKLLLDTVLKVSEEEFKERRYVECGFERPIKLSYAFYEDLLQQEDIMKMEVSNMSLILHGDCDDIVPLSDIMEFCGTHKKVQLEIIQGADHRFKKAKDIEKVIEHTKKFLHI